MKPLFWFRRDLRLFNNDALSIAVKSGADKALFFVTEKQWSVHGVANIQIDLLKRRLDYLGNKLASYGVSLHVLDVDTYDDIPSGLVSFCNEFKISHVFANKEYEINEVNRDKQCFSLGINLNLYDGDLITKPGSVVSKSGSMFKVFTPFKKALIAKYGSSDFSSLEFKPSSSNTHLEWDAPESIRCEGLSNKWPVDDASLDDIVNKFIKNKLTAYKLNRDIPSIKGTSGLSPYLALGVVSVKSLIHKIMCLRPDVLQDINNPNFCWINELIWREFYRHLIVEYPELCKYQDFNKKYSHIKWSENVDHLEAWKLGKTGYPIVDAAMRQLNETGWMHNRLRMIVASFLTKHLLIDWRYGERYFMSKLIDGDFASNIGGWQWASSTGCDAQPYFRIFNPITQSQKFDPDGVFIRRYVKELADVPNKYIHFPHEYLLGKKNIKYVKPLVDHKIARAAALEVFKG